jgi:osmotically-inducible protein OsmY
MKRYGIILAIILISPLYADLSGLKPAVQLVAQTKFPQDSAYNSSDREINQRIRDSLGDDWLGKGYDDLSFHTSKGNVVINGTVDDPSDVLSLVNLVRNIDGVKNISSGNITVRKRE